MKLAFLFSLLVPVAFALAIDPPATSRVVDPMIFPPGIWEKPSDQIVSEAAPLGFEWTSTAKDSARSAVPGLVLGAQPVTEAVLRFNAGLLSSATLLYYSRGNAGDITEEQFESRLAAIREALTSATGVQPVDRGRDSSSAVRAEGAVWETPSTQFLLEWSVTRASRVKMIPFRAEFIRLTVQPKNTRPAPIGSLGASTANTSRAAVAKFVAADHIQRTPSGDMMLKDVPMVDQGQKGYCVVASVERIMRYYGASVDQDELAQIANSDASKGTNSTQMVDSLKKLTARLGVKTRSIYDWDFKEFMSVMADYNRATKRGKVAPEVPLGGSVIDMDVCLSTVQPELYKQVRLKKTADFGKFQREIQRNIDEGIPLLWSVRLGLIPEKGLPQIGGNHMRLIIGYNPSKKEIIYSDSWGLGHEEKRMSFEDAWTMTTGLDSLQPIGT